MDESFFDRISFAINSSNLEKVLPNFDVGFVRVKIREDTSCSFTVRSSANCVWNFKTTLEVLKIRTLPRVYVKLSTDIQIIHKIWTIAKYNNEGQVLVSIFFATAVWPRLAIFKVFFFAVSVIFAVGVWVSSVNGDVASTLTISLAS